MTLDVQAAGDHTVTAAAPGAARSTPSAGLPRRAVDGVALAALLVVMARVTIAAAGPLHNSDTWFHLRIGHELWGPWSLSHPGALSSAATSSWVPTQWSTEMLAAKFEDWFGLPGVAWVFGALFLAFILVVYLASRAQASTLPSAVATGLAVIVATPALSARPQVVSLILLGVSVALWLRAWEHGRVPWLLVPLTWVWATAHGLWSAGLVVGVVCCIGLVADRRVNPRAALRMFSVPVLCLVAACLTPLGPHLLSSQLAVGERTRLIGEWQATSFRTLPAFVVGLMIAVLVMCWARRGHVPWTHVLLLLVAAGWAALVNRMVAPGGVIVAPLLAGALQAALAKRSPRRSPGRGELSVVLGGVVACLALLAVAVPHTAKQPAGVPAAFAPRLAALPPGTPVAVEDATGAWLEWRYPELDPTIDGMLDAYPVSYIRDFGEFQDVDPGWQSFLRRSGARVGILVKGSPLSAAVQAQLGWHVVDRDGPFLYVVAPDAS